MGRVKYLETDTHSLIGVLVRQRATVVDHQRAEQGIQDASTVVMGFVGPASANGIFDG